MEIFVGGEDKILGTRSEDLTARLGIWIEIDFFINSWINWCVARIVYIYIYVYCQCGALLNRWHPAPLFKRVM
jgi:hypothetical protein